ncbi:hypothetical protein AgCh_000963 [Apium graveolens]
MYLRGAMRKALHERVKRKLREARKMKKEAKLKKNSNVKLKEKLVISISGGVALSAIVDDDVGGGDAGGGDVVFADLNVMAVGDEKEGAQGGKIGKDVNIESVTDDVDKMGAAKGGELVEGADVKDVLEVDVVPIMANNESLKMVEDTREKSRRRSLRRSNVLGCLERLLRTRMERLLREKELKKSNRSFNGNEEEGKDFKGHHGTIENCFRYQNQSRPLSASLSYAHQKAIFLHSFIQAQKSDGAFWLFPCSSNGLYNGLQGRGLSCIVIGWLYPNSCYLVVITKGMDKIFDGMKMGLVLHIISFEQLNG